MSVNERRNNGQKVDADREETIAHEDRKKERKYGIDLSTVHSRPAKGSR